MLPFPDNFSSTMICTVRQFVFGLLGHAHVSMILADRCQSCKGLERVGIMPNNKCQLYHNITLHRVGDVPVLKMAVHQHSPSNLGSVGAHPAKMKGGTAQK